jgi:hypothetical protein
MESVMKKLIFVFLLVPSFCFAEPSPSIQSLMKESVSLFDLGMVRTDDHLKSFCSQLDFSSGDLFGDDTYAFCVSGYDFDKNRISLNILISNTRDEIKLDDVKSEGKRIFESLRKWFGVDPKNGKLVITYIGDYFSHQGYSTAKQPKTSQPTMENVVEIHLDIASKNHKYFLNSQGKLLSDEVFFSQ